MKHRVFTSTDEVREFEAGIVEIADTTVRRLFDRSQDLPPMSFLASLKFTKVGYDPLDAHRPLNLVEQLNQTFTYLVTARGIEILFEKHPEAAPFEVNLGTRAGSDIESQDGTVAAEAFAATHPRSNRKLYNDIERVSATAAQHKYVFFFCPGQHEPTQVGLVKVIPVALDHLQEPQ